MNLKTIAQQAGVSTATVSNVVNGNFHKVSEETRKRVEAIIKETDYKPNAMARSLAKKESRIIGLVVPYVNARYGFLTNPYNAHIIASLEQIVRAHDYYLMIRCVDRCSEILPMLSSWNVDGAIFLGVAEDEVAQIRRDLSSPTVFVDTYTQEDTHIVNVGIDDYRGGYLSARYLLGKGHRKLALVLPRPSVHGVISERYRGFLDACREGDLEFNEETDIFYTDAIYQNAIEVGQSIAFSGSSFTAVAAMSDVTAIGLIEGLHQCGVRVPEDISVIGFDDLPESDYIRPKLTTIAQNYERKAALAGEYLFRMIDGEEIPEANEREPIRIVERQSVQAVG